MKSGKEMYPDYTEPFYGPGNYGPMLESIGEIVVQVDDNDYQGDSRVLYRDGDKWGVLLFGWGSCSGCDSLQACERFEDIERLRDGLAESVRWGSREETIAHLNSKDWESHCTWREDESKRFVKEALAALGAE